MSFSELKSERCSNGTFDVWRNAYIEMIMAEVRKQFINIAVESLNRNRDWNRHCRSRSNVTKKNNPRINNDEQPARTRSFPSHGSRTTLRNPNNLICVKLNIKSPCIFYRNIALLCNNNKPSKLKNIHENDRN